jgi:hypothetical protein
LLNNLIEISQYICDATLKKQEKSKRTTTTGKLELVYSPGVYEEILKFLRACLKESAKQAKLEPFQYVGKILEDVEGKDKIIQYLRFIDQCIGKY